MADVADIGLKDPTELRVLVIDDDDLVRLTLGQLLEREGFEVAEAAGGAEGIAMQKGCPADVVVADFFMPGQDLGDVVRELREDNPGIKIIVISGSFTDDEQVVPEAIRDLEVDGHLLKPFSADQLVNKVRSIL